VVRLTSNRSSKIAASAGREEPERRRKSPRRLVATRTRLAGAGIEVIRIPPRSPKANAYSERFVLTTRTEVTDRTLIFGERHLRRVLAQYEAHYNGRRPHRGRQLHPPVPDHPVADLSPMRVKRRPVLGGLLNEYERAA
jgi:putative transposase